MMNNNSGKLINKNVTITGLRTSLSLEQTIWDAIDEICQREGLTAHQLFALIENSRQDNTRTSAVRSFVVSYLRALVSESSLHRKGNISSILSENISGLHAA